MEHRFSGILTPLRIGDVVLKNRLLMTKAISQELQGPESFPAEATIKFCADAAKNGAAIVTCTPGAFPEVREGPFGSVLQTEDRRVQSYFGKMIDRIHAYGSLASASMQSFMPDRYVISDIRDRSRLPRQRPHGPPNRENPAPEMTREQIKEFIEMFTRHCVYLKNIGFDMVNIYMSYNASMLAKTLSPVYNQREDEYGGCAENRARLTKELFSSIKQACGKNFLIEAQISGEEDNPYGYKLEDTLTYLRECEGLIDIVQLRTGDNALVHPTSYCMRKNEPFSLGYAEAVKAAGIKVVTAPSGGFQDPDFIEKCIREGKTDMVAMARAFICDPEYGKKLIEGRGEDIVPCLRCDKCHGAVCSLNPKNGNAYAWSDMFEPEPAPKKVAVVGGGPAGMQAALVADSRGHEVTLFEKSDRLGGQMLHADYIPEKWAVRDFKDFQIRQLEKSAVKVELNTANAVEAVKSGGFDAVIAACGAEPKVGPVPGADRAEVWAPIDVFGREAELGHRVVVIGGTMVGVDTGIYLAQHGHEVTVITRNREIGHDHMAHGRDATVDFLDKLPGFSYITEAAAVLIDEAGVVYRTPEQEELRLPADSVVFSAGKTPRLDDCMELAGLTPFFRVVGDCNIQLNDLWLVHDLEPQARFPSPDMRQSIYTATTAALSV